MIAYDQGQGDLNHSGHNSQFRVFRNVDYRQLTYYYLGNIATFDHDNTILYDIFTYQGTIITTGRTEQDSQHITLAQCGLDNGNRKLNCQQDKSSLVQEGYVSIHNESVMVTVDIKSRIISAYQLQGKYTDSTWVGATLGQITSADLVDQTGIWVNGVSYSSTGAGISWAQGTKGAEFGTTFVSWKQNISRVNPNFLGFAWEKSFIFGDMTSGYAFLNRNEVSELIISQAALQNGDNTVTASAVDREGSQNSTATITLLNGIYDTCKWAPNPVEDLTVTSGASGFYNMSESTIQTGNGLFVNAISSNSTFFSIDEVYFGRMTDVQLAGVTNLAGNFLFDVDKALIELDNRIDFQKCTQATPTSAVPCTSFGFKYNVQDGQVLGNRILALNSDTTLAFLQNYKTGTTTFLVASPEGIYIFERDTIVTSVAKYLGVTAVLDYVAISYDNTVEILAVNKNDYKEWQTITTLSSTNFDETDFCPVELRSNQRRDGSNSQGWFVILSNCNNGNNQSQAVFTWAVTSNTPNYNLPLSSLDNPRNICAFMDEILVLSNERIYGISIKDDMNFWSVPTNTFNVDTDRGDLICLESINMALFMAHEVGADQRQSIFIRGNSGYRQDIRYPRVFPSLNSNRYNAYDFMDSIMVVSEVNQGVGFVQTYIKPMISYTAGPVTQDTDVTVTLTLTCGNGMKDTYSQKVTVKKANSAEDFEVATE
jgi:hypothetical protein